LERRSATDPQPSYATCTACGQALPAEDVIVRVSIRKDSRAVPHGPHMAVAGPSGIHGVGQPALRQEPGGWHLEHFDRFISHLANGETRRYTAGQYPEWREGANVCRKCRDARLPAGLAR